MNMHSTATARQLARVFPQTPSFAWNAALADYEAKRAVSDALADGDASADKAVNAYCDAMDHLIDEVPAPDLAAVIKKMELMKERYEGFEYPDVAETAVMDDLRRLTAALEPSGRDNDLLAADDRLNRSLAAIEARGTFYGAERHSPADADQYDAAVDFVGRELASTIEGLLAKAWVAWSAITDGHTEENMRFADLVNRRDLEAIVPTIADLDWEHHVMCTLVQSITKMMEKGGNTLTHASVADTNVDSQAVVQAQRMEEIILQASHVLKAIDHGGLLDAAPPQDGDYERHSVAVGLLDMLGDTVRRYEDSSEFATDLSIHLAVRA